MSLAALLGRAICLRASFHCRGRGLFYAPPNFPSRASRVAISRAVRSSRFKDIAEFIFRLDGRKEGEGDARMPSVVIRRRWDIKPLAEFFTTLVVEGEY